LLQIIGTFISWSDVSEMCAAETPGSGDLPQGNFDAGPGVDSELRIERSPAPTFRGRFVAALCAVAKRRETSWWLNPVL
jgi:hypothetical protein